MKIAYCGYDFFHGCLDALLAHGCQVGQVFTMECDNRLNFNEYIHHTCEERGIPLSTGALRESDLLRLREEGYELIMTAAYKYKIPDLTAFGLRGVNVHPTLLPVGRGVWPLPWTLLTDQQQSGVTLHKLTKELDAGDILLQRAMTLSDRENLETLSARLQMLAAEMVVELLADFDALWQNARPQMGQVVHWPMPGHQERTLDWHLGVAQLDRICRAFGKFGCYGHFDDRDWVVYRLDGWLQAHNYAPGQVVHKTNTEMIVAAADGLVSLQWFQPAEN